MKVRVNTDFTLSLESNPTTGYIWEPKFDNKFLRLKSRDFKVSDSRSVGSGGTEVFTFVPLIEGKTEIKLIYKRPWESTQAKESLFEIEIES